MKHSRFRKPMAFLLALMLCVTMVSPAFAARITLPGSSSSSSYSWSDLWNKIFGKGDDNTTDTDTSEDINDPELTLIEDETTVAEGTKLRASTYEATPASTDDDVSAQAAEDTNEDSATLKYFPVTMYNYDATTINNATHQVEVDKGLGRTWDGIYFNDGNPSAESYKVGTEKYIPKFSNSAAQVENGQYLLVNKNSGQALTNKTGNYQDATGLQGTTTWSDATVWTITTTDNGYTICDEKGQYMTLANKSSNVVTEPTDIQLVSYTGDTACVQILQDGYYLNRWGGKQSTYAGWGTSDDQNQAFYLYKVTGDKIVKTDSLSYAHYNYWTGHLTSENGISNSSSPTDQKGYVYQGLVADEMENGQIKFNVPDGGIFDPTDTTKKSVYTKVGLPFVYNKSTHYYTFDASQDSARFAEDPASGINLTWNNKPQYNKNNNNANTHYGFYPFNSEVKENTGYLELAQSADYHFGMAASIDFNMTTDGKLNDDDIKFSFAGDDDVWVFIDGKLVLDLGGIHDSVSAEINFAKNTYSITPTDPKTTKGGFTVDGSKADLSGNLFNADEVTGKLNTTLQTFAATTNHTLTIYYLERGQGASNCKIEFNLPQKDYISVTKAIDDYLYDNSGNIAQNTDGTKLTVSDELKESLRNRAYTYTLYCDNKAVAGAQYIIYNENGESTDTGYTGDDGTFQVKYGETVRIIQDNLDGKYKVVESGLTDAYITPGWTDSGHAATTYESAGSANALTSEIVTAKGSGDATDYINFTCTNKLKYPVADIAEDIVVIDYGIPDAIDVLSNDTYTVAGHVLTLAGLAADEDTAKTSNNTSLTGTYGTAKIENGKVVYTLSKQMTGIETIYYNVGLDNSEESTGVGKLTIIPATTMYYEENFDSLVTYYKNKKLADSENKDDNWSLKGTADTFYQEEGRVNDTTDSPYGSDAGYRKNSTDSYGTSMYVSTENGAQQFSYTFTGTGTSFFARTNDKTGYMRVKLEAQGETSKDNDKTIYRDTVYKATEDTNKGTLYNIPVYTMDGLPYGNYKVTVMMYQGTEKNGFGTEFWLDGIRVVNPMFDPESKDPLTSDQTVAANAYAADGEANNKIVTLRQKLLTEYVDETTGDWIESKDGTFVLFTDIDGEMKTASEYQSYGPKEEVYMTNGQSVSFALKDWDADANRIYLGIKAPTGSGTVEINGHSLSIGNSVDNFYDIGSYVTITTDAKGNKIATFKIESTSSLISITNIKVTGNAVFGTVPGDDVDIEGSGDKEGENEKSI